MSSYKEDWRVPAGQEDSPYISESSSVHEDEAPLIFYTQSQRNSRRSSRFLTPKRLKVLIALGIGALVFMLSRAHHIRNRQSVAGSRPLEWYERQKAGVFGDSIDSPWNSTGAVQTWTKPEGFRIVGMVFYGRAMFVDVLDCYLKNNLVTNGGYLDEVWFMQNTAQKDDIEYLTRLVETEPLYRQIKVADGGKEFDKIWTYPTDNNTMYIKIDDDMVYVHEEAIPRVVHTLLDHPEAHDVAANIVNSPLTNWFHHRLGAVYPYLPELQPPQPPSAESGLLSWRASELPHFPHEELAAEEYDWSLQADKDWEPIETGQPGGPPFVGHRWLPLNHTAAALMKTPIHWSHYDAFGRELRSWAMAAQQQYSLLQNIEDGNMHRYWFGRHDDGLWNMQYERYNLNFLAIWGRSVTEMPPGWDDEFDLTAVIPKKLKKPLLIDTKAIVAHFNFGPQPEVKLTDLLDRYRAYANEYVCSPFNQKKPLNMADFKRPAGSGMPPDAAATTPVVNSVPAVALDVNNKPDTVPAR